MISLNILENEIHLVISKIEEEDLNDLLIHLLSPSNINKKLKIFLNSKGGSINALIVLLNVLKNYKDIETHLLNEAYSAASFLFLIGNERIVYDNSVLMIHAPTIKIHNSYERIENDLKIKKYRIHNLINKYYAPFLTKEEIERSLKGEEIFFTAEELLERKIATKKI